MFCKSEALFNLCNFEYALLGYLKGSRLAPDWECFKLGHIKCKKAINNSLTPDTFKISGLEGELLVAFLNTFDMKTLYQRADQSNLFKLRKASELLKPKCIWHSYDSTGVK